MVATGIGEFQQQRKKKMFGMETGVILMYNKIGISLYGPSLLMHHYFPLGICTGPMVLRHFLIWKKNAFNTWKADTELPKGRQTDSVVGKVLGSDSWVHS